MKTLKPRMIQEYRCDYCNKKYRMKTACEKHERVCYKNPNRDCNMCEGNGTISEYQGEIDCYACKTAAERGGKCYIEDYKPEKELF